MINENPSPESLAFFRQKVEKRFGAEEVDMALYPDPFSFLRYQKWLAFDISIQREELFEMNFKLEGNSPFVQMVKAAFCLDRRYPKEKFYLAEVRENVLHRLIKLKGDADKWNDFEYIANFLQYENSHMVFVWENKQFDLTPFFIQGRSVFLEAQHRIVKHHYLWEGLHALYLINEAYRLRNEASDLIEFLRTVHRVSNLYPDNLFAKENIVFAQYLLSNISIGKEVLDKSLAYAEPISDPKDMAKGIILFRSNLKILWLLWLLDEKKQIYRNRIARVYGQSMLDFLDNNGQLL